MWRFIKINTYEVWWYSDRASISSCHFCVYWLPEVRLTIIFHIRFKSLILISNWCCSQRGSFFDWLNVVSNHHSLVLVWLFHSKYLWIFNNHSGIDDLFQNWQLVSLARPRLTLDKKPIILNFKKFVGRRI